MRLNCPPHAIAEQVPLPLLSLPRGDGGHRAAGVGARLPRRTLSAFQFSCFCKEHVGSLQVVTIREAMEDIARLESAVASGRAAPAEVEQLKHAADDAVEDLRCHVDSEALTAAARHEGLILHEVRVL